MFYNFNSWHIKFLTLIFLAFFACKKENIQNPQPISSLVLIPDQRMPYTFTHTDGRLMLRSIPGLPIYATRLAETQNWLHLHGEKLQSIIGGIDTLGLELDEFFDSLHPGIIRKTPISVYANGLQTIITEISQKSFPFIFSTDISKIKNPQITNSHSQAANQTNSTLRRQGKLWTLNICLQDTDKIIFLPIYYSKSPSPSLHYSRGPNATEKDSLLYNVSQQAPKENNGQNSFKFIAKDTNLLNEKYLYLKLRADKTSVPINPIAIISVGENSEKITLQINTCQ